MSTKIFFDSSKSKWVAMVNNSVVAKSKSKNYVEQKVKEFSSNSGDPSPALSKFTINQKFGFITDMVRMVAGAEQPSVIVCGSGGLGKSHTVIDTLEKAGYKNISTIDEMEVGAFKPKKCFRIIKGFASAKGIYRALYENRDNVLVLDDCDSALKDPVSLNLLKSALDSYSKRVISYKADFRDEDLPSSFEYRGRIVFISNLSSYTLDQAIISRSMVVDLTMNNKQKIERMRFLLESKDFMPEFNKQHKQDALDLIEKNFDEVKDLSLRTLIQVTKIRNSNPNNNWKSLAEYCICGG